MGLQLLTVARAAELLGVHEDTVRRLIERGELACVRIGRAVRIEESELERLVGRGRPRRPPAPDPLPMTAGQMRAFYAKCGDLDEKQKQEKGTAKRGALALAARQFERPFTSSTQLRESEASWLLDQLTEQLEALD